MFQINRTTQWLFCAFALAQSSGCDLFQGLTATKVVSGILISAPAIAYPGLFSVPAEVAATAWVGERESGTSTEEPKPLLNVAVSVTFAGTSVTLPAEPDQPGAYLATSTKNASLTYRAGENYEFLARIGETFGGEVTAPDLLTTAALTLAPALGQHATIAALKTHPKDTALKVTWPQSTGRYGYVSVFRADRAHPDKPELVFDTRPKTSGEALKFVLDDPPSSAEIPATTFSVDGLYALLVVTMNRGDPKDGTFVGSPFLAGSGVVDLFIVGNFVP